MNSKNIILKAENISKQYRLGTVGTGTLSHDLNRWWHMIRGKEDPYLKVGDVNDRSTKASSNYVWALKNINFEVNRGEVLGIIGKNGAGKSTLLKILSKVTAPTTGTIKSRGRIASLLEVGTGFNPELTGRENIYLNGAILGMTKKEITLKLPEIIEFSGCERYIDTPTKRYSSGMTVRLAFAVAAFLEPELLVVDEVLAVGDAEFQKKAIGKMQAISKEGGRTVLFVSHNMAAVKSLCTRAILLRNGEVYAEGDVDKIITEYVKLDSDNLSAITDFSEYKNKSDFFTPKYFGVKAELGKLSFKNNDEIKINVKFELSQIVKNFNFGIAVYDLNENLLFWSFNTDVKPFLDGKIGENDFDIEIPKHLVNEGEYNIHFLVSVFNEYWIFEPNNNAPVIRLIIEGGLSDSDFWKVKRPGMIAPILNYSTNQ